MKNLPKTTREFSKTNLNVESAKFPFTITHLGRSGGSYTLFATNHAERKAWKEAIEMQKTELTKIKQKFQIVPIIDNFFQISNRVNCCAFSSQKLVIGTDAGVYVGPRDGHGRFEKLLDLERVLQISILEEYDLVLILAGKVKTIPTNNFYTCFDCNDFFIFILFLCQLIFLSFINLVSFF